MTDLRGEVRLSLSNFPCDPQAEGRKLRQFADSSWEEFVQEADTLLAGGEDSSTARFLMAIYATRGRLIPFLARLMQSHRENGRKAARLASRLDPELDRRLAESILNAQKGDDAGATQPALLEVLAETERSEIILPVLGSLRESEDPRVRSKLALLVGRAARAQAWIRVLRQDPDSRVRANAIESLWDVGSAFAAVCFDLGMKDAHPRVAANAAVGLHRLGDARSVARLVEMAESPEIENRKSAAWAMGETRDARFVPLLWKFRRGEDPGLAALAATSCEKILLAQAESNRHPAVVIALGAQRTANGTIVARSAVLDSTKNPVLLREVDWRPKLGSQPVWRYSVRQVDGLPRVAVAVLLPKSPNGADRWGELLPATLREGLKAKRAGDSIAVSYYGEPSTTETAEQERASNQPKAVLLTADVRMAVHAAAPAGISNLVPLHVAASTCLGTLRQFNGGKHLLIVVDRPSRGSCNVASLLDLAAKAAEAGVTCHGICGADTETGLRMALRAVAHSTAGFHLQLDDAGSLQGALGMLMPAFIRHFEIILAPVERSEQLDIEVASERLAGRARWKVELESPVGSIAPDIHWDGESDLPLEPADPDNRGVAPADSGIRV